MHMLFYGNPGMGKTTLARIVGRIYKQEGLLRIGNFYETTGNYFVEGLVSELMKKTRISPEAYESKEFSNARFIRNLYERVWGKAAYRIRFEEDKERILKVEDMKAALEEEMFASLVETKTTRRIGFVMD